MDSALITNLYRFFIKANKDVKGVEASLVLSSVAGAAGYSIIEKYLPKLESEALKAGSNVFIEDVSAELNTVYGELLRYASAAGINPDPNSGWIGTPSSPDDLAEHILKFNQAHFGSIKEIVEDSGSEGRFLRSALLGLCCMLLKQVGGTVIPVEEGKKIITWSLQCGSKMSPLKNELEI